MAKDSIFGISKESKAEVEKKTIDPNDYQDYGDYVAAKKAAEGGK